MSRETHHVRHSVEGPDYLRHEARLMLRWCHIYGRTASEFVVRHAGNYAGRHGAGGAGVPGGSPGDVPAGHDGEDS